MMPKIVQVTTDTIINGDGELLQQEQRNVIQYEPEPNYIKIYLDNILYLTDIPAGLNGILMHLLTRMTYNNEVIINAAIKRRIAKELDMSVGTVNNAITKFTKGQILKRIDTGIYKFNPHLFGRGKWEDIQRIRLEVTFEPGKKTVKANIEKKEEGL